MKQQCLHIANDGENDLQSVVCVGHFGHNRKKMCIESINASQVESSSRGPIRNVMPKISQESSVAVRRFKLILIGLGRIRRRTSHFGYNFCVLPLSF